MEIVHIARKEELQRKIRRMREGGISQLQVVADFDRTLTKAFVSGKKFLSSYALIREGKYLTPDYPTKAQALFEEYHPYEISSTISVAERNKKMVEWWSKHFKLMKECGMSKEVIRDIVLKGKIQFREGVLEFLQELSEKNIPILILSAGMGDIIQELLSVLGKGMSNIHLISNFYNFDENGRVVGMKNNIFIHPFNKNELEMKRTSHYFKMVQRKNVLLLGDSLGDLSMTEGIEPEVIIRIGFLNDNKEQLLEKYMQEFEVVITDDGDMEYVNEMVEEIISAKD